MEVLLGFLQNLLVLIKLHRVFRLQKAKILIGPLSSAVLAGGLALLFVKLGDDSMLPVLLLYLHGRNLKPVSCGFVLTFISDLVKVVDAHVYNLIFFFCIGLIVLNGIEYGLRHIFLLFREALLAALA